MDQFEKLKEAEANLQQKLASLKAEAHDLGQQIKEYTELAQRKQDELARVTSQMLMLQGKIEGVRSLFYL